MKALLQTPPPLSGYAWESEGQADVETEGGEEAMTGLNWWQRMRRMMIRMHDRLAPPAVMAGVAATLVLIIDWAGFCCKWSNDYNHGVGVPRPFADVWTKWPFVFVAFFLALFAISDRDGRP